MKIVSNTSPLIAFSTLKKFITSVLDEMVKLEESVNFRLSVEVKSQIIEKAGE